MTKIELVTDQGVACFALTGEGVVNIPISSTHNSFTLTPGKWQICNLAWAYQQTVTITGKITGFKCMTATKFRILDKQNSDLQTIICQGANIPELDVSDINTLQTLELSHTQKLTTLNITKLPNLKSFYLYLGLELLSSINVKVLTNLESIDWYNDKFTNLDVSGMTKLKKVKTRGLTALNVSGCTALETLECEESSYYTAKLTKLNVDNLKKLKTLNCRFNSKLNELTMTGCESLESINCFKTEVKSLNLAGLTNLKTLDCGYCKLTALNVSSLKKLEKLYCNGNQLDSLDVSNLTNLEILICSYNKLRSLNVNNCTSLYYIECSNNLLNQLDLSKMNAIVRISLDKILLAKELGVQEIASSSKGLGGQEITPSIKGLGGQEIATSIKELEGLEIAASIKEINGLEISSPRKEIEGLGKIEISTILPEWVSKKIPKIDLLRSFYISALTTLVCTNNSFTKLELTNNNLNNITFGNSALATVNLKGCTKLDRINFENWSQNKPNLDLSGHTQFSTLYICSNMGRLNLTGCSSLKKIIMAYGSSVQEMITTPGATFSSVYEPPENIVIN